MAQPESSVSEVGATIIREGLAHGFLESRQGVRVTREFRVLFEQMLRSLEHADVIEYTEHILTAHPQTQGDFKEFMGRFVGACEELPAGVRAMDLVLNNAGNITDTHYVSLRAVLGLAAFTIHRNRFPVTEPNVQRAARA